MTKTFNQKILYDGDYMYPSRWEVIERFLNNRFSQNPFYFLDIGGGNGLFTDRVLMAFKNSKGVNIDYCKELIKINKPNDRKEVILEDVENLGNLFKKETFDIIFMNWVLHHLIDRTYNLTLRKIRNVLQLAKFLLVNDGFLSIYENCYESYFLNTAPSKLMFICLKSKHLLPITRKMRPNTAGIGICYLSHTLWEIIFCDLGYKILTSTKTDEHSINKIEKLFFNLKKLNCINFLLKKKSQ